jgi:prepilin-type N-terminal cleavage/methylation domain-containing protein
MGQVGDSMKRNSCGMTLIEIILALAILAVIALAILPAFTSSFKGIMAAGKKSDIVFQSQNETEDKILEGANTIAFTINIAFPGVPPVTQQGEAVTKGAIHLFIPK